MSNRKPSAILFSQCLQNDFVEPIQKYDPLPNLLHVGYSEALRLMGENPSEGALLAFMQWALHQPNEELTIVHIRDWHDPNDPEQKGHLDYFSPHCLKGTRGAQFVYENMLADGSPLIVDASGLNDFHHTSLKETLDQLSIDQDTRLGIIGVWTEAKVSFLAYELATRYPGCRLGVCTALTASSSRNMHYVSLDQMHNILGVEVFSSVGGFTEFLTGNSILLAPGGTAIKHKVQFSFSGKVNVSQNDEELLYYLFRDCKSVDFNALDGGFSGNLVLLSRGVDTLGHNQVPTVTKIGPRDPIAKERTAFERIEEVLGNAAPRIVDFAEIGDRGGIKYRYAAMTDEKTKVFQDRYEEAEPLEDIFYYLDVVFKKQLGRLYDAGEPEKLNLLTYYDFQSKYAGGVRKRMAGILGMDPGDEEHIDFGNEIHPPNKPLYNLALFYEKDLTALHEESSEPHYVSYLHGDLNGKNIIIDARKNVWLIDFFHTHRGHIIKDLLKLENDILYIFTKITDDEWEEALKLTDVLINQADLGIPLKVDEGQFESPMIQRAWETICHLRSYYPELIQLDRNPYQMMLGLLRYSVHTLSFDECTPLQKKWALHTSCRLAEKIKNYLLDTRRLRIDFLEVPNQKGKIGITILPGRKDRERNLDEDLQEMKTAEITKVYSLITDDEYREYGVPESAQKIKASGFEFAHYPIMDQGIPDRNTLDKILNDMQQHIEKGQNVLVHCVGGLGRSGTVAVAYLMKKCGMGFPKALELVRSVRSKRAVESKLQWEFLEGL